MISESALSICAAGAGSGSGSGLCLGLDLDGGGGGGGTAFFFGCFFSSVLILCEEEEVDASVPEMQVEELKQKLDAGEDLYILDVREPHEYQICNIGGHLIPLGDLPKRVSELDSSREIVAHCRSGVRSAKAVNFLKQAGFKKVRNLAGGILAWADRVDTSMPKY